MDPRHNRAAARALDESTYVQIAAVLGDDHPDTVSAAINLSVSRAGSDPEFHSTVADKIRSFAERHPRASLIREGERINTYIEPPSP